MRTMKGSGVYAIVCEPLGHVYIGSTTTSFRRRFNQHRCDLRRGRAGSWKLQRAWTKHGESAFLFLPIETCHPDTTLEREQHYIDAFEPQLNVSPRATHGPTEHTRTAAFKAAASSRTKEMWAQGAFKPGRQPDRNFYDIGDGRQLSVKQICDEFGLKKVTVAQRIKSGVRGADLVSKTHLRHTSRLVGSAT